MTELLICPERVDVEVELPTQQPKFASVSRRVVVRLDAWLVEEGFEIAGNDHRKSRIRGRAFSPLTSFSIRTYTDSKSARQT